MAAELVPDPEGWQDDAPDPRALPAGEIPLPLSCGLRRELERLHDTGLFGDSLPETARQILASRVRELRDWLAGDIPW